MLNHDLNSYFCAIINYTTLTLIKSISGIRGTIGGPAGEGLTPVDIVKFTSAFGTWALKKGGVTGQAMRAVGRNMARANNQRGR